MSNWNKAPTPRRVKDFLDKVGSKEGCAAKVLREREAEACAILATEASLEDCRKAILARCYCHHSDDWRVALRMVKALYHLEGSDDSGFLADLLTCFQEDNRRLESRHWAFLLALLQLTADQAAWQGFMQRYREVGEQKREFTLKDKFLAKRDRAVCSILLEMSFAYFPPHRQEGGGPGKKLGVELNKAIRRFCCDQTGETGSFNRGDLRRWTLLQSPARERTIRWMFKKAHERLKAGERINPLGHFLLENMLYARFGAYSLMERLHKLGHAKLPGREEEKIMHTRIKH